MTDFRKSLSGMLFIAVNKRVQGVGDNIDELSELLLELFKVLELTTALHINKHFI